MTAAFFLQDQWLTKVVSSCISHFPWQTGPLSQKELFSRDEIISAEQRNYAHYEPA